MHQVNFYSIVNKQIVNSLINCLHHLPKCVSWQSAPKLLTELIHKRLGQTALLHVGGKRF